MDSKSNIEKKLEKNQSNGILSKNKRPKKSTGHAVVKPFEYEEVETVAELSQQYFPMSRVVSKEHIADMLVNLYFKNAPIHPDIYSLVSRSPDGTVNGFLGITGKRFYYKGQEKIAAHCNHLMATESGRAALVPMRLLQKFLTGPQDFSFSDGSVDSARRIWERLGGTPSVVNSIYYKIPLRPFSFISRPFKENLNRFFQLPLNLFSKGMDGIASGLRIPFFYRKKSTPSLYELQPSLLLEGFKKIENHYELLPRYRLTDIEILFYLLESEKRYGTLQKYGLKDDNGNLLGWFIYYAKKQGVCEVIQAVSIPGYENELYQMLTWHAFEQGGVELSGRLMSNQIGSQFTGKSLSMPGRMWTLIHSNDPDLKLALQSGKAFITRLEGDLWLI